MNAAVLILVVPSRIDTFTRAHQFINNIDIDIDIIFIIAIISLMSTNLA